MSAWDRFRRSFAWIAFVLLAFILLLLQAQLWTIQDNQARTQREILRSQHLILQNQAGNQRILNAALASLSVTQRYLNPHSSYRIAVDAALCAELRDVREIASKLHIDIKPLLTPKNAIKHVVVGGCTVSVVKP